MTTVLILALCVVVLWAGSKVLNRLHKVIAATNNPARGSMIVETSRLRSKPFPGGRTALKQRLLHKPAL
jgi:hypothetical protein